MKRYRLKHTFTAGELSPLMGARVDFDRYRHGCKVLKNMVCATQGPAVRRSGFRYIYDLTAIGMDTTDPRLRMIPFIFNELQSYVMIFYMHTDGYPRIVFGNGTGLVVYSSPAITECPPGTGITPPTPGNVVSITLPANWDIEGFDYAQSADEVYFAQKDYAPYVLKRYTVGSTSSDCWVLSAPVFVDPPAEWNSTDGYPQRVTFHQQRLVFASNYTYRQRIWMSKAGDFFTFTSPSTLTEDAAVTFSLDSGTQDQIQWMVSSKSLNVGTMGNEWTVTGSTQYPITPYNVLAQRQTNHGSEANQALVIGITTLFVERHGRRVNEFTYDYTTDSYRTSDMAILSPHITEEYSLTDWAYQQSPDSIVWGIRSDGTLVGITYQRQHKVVGWHTHDTEGLFKSLCVIPGDTREDDLWAVVRRSINGATKYYIEKMDDFFTADDAEWGRFLDSFLVYQGAATSTISGLSHLEGETVDILADGAAHPQVTVSSGQITLDNEYTHVVVGFGYTSEVRPLLPDTAMQDGTSIGRVKQILRLHIDFYKTVGITLGRYNTEEGESTEFHPFRVPTDLTGNALPLFTGIKVFDFMEGYDTMSEYFIRQTQPFPSTIRSIVDEVEVSE